MTSSRQLRSDQEVGGALEAADLVLIGDGTDQLLASVGEVAEKRSLRAPWLERSAFTRQVTVFREAGRVLVKPDLPLLLRRQGAPQPRDAADKLSVLELQAQLWSLAALASSPVVNRPSLASGSNDLGSHNLLALLRSLPGARTIPFVEEYFSSHRHNSAAFEQTGVPGAADPLVGSSWRRRPRMSADWIYRVVIVVGELAWIRNYTQGLTDDLRGLSILAARVLGLDFCAFYWRTAPRSSQIALAKVVSHPHCSELDSLAQVVASALVDRLVPWSH